MVYKTHGYSHAVNGAPTPEYKAWASMKQRCLNLSAVDYPKYGGRGIKICERWLASFSNFLEDMGPRPLRHSLDRVNNDGDYEPSNCRWSTHREQNANSRNCRYLEFNGERRLLGHWATELGISDYRLSWRLAHGWTVERTLTTPTRKWTKTDALIREIKPQL